MYRKEYRNLRRQCQLMLNNANGNAKEAKDVSDNQNIDPMSSEDLICAHESLSREVTVVEKEDDANVEQAEEQNENIEPDDENEKVEASDSKSPTKNEGKVEEEVEDKSGLTVDVSGMETDSPDSESSVNESLCPSETIQESNKFSKDSRKDEDHKVCSSEDFATWQRIIRLDALRTNADWVLFSSSQAAISEAQAREAALAVGLEDYDHLEPCRIYHAARLVAILEAYAIYDPEIGYCQGMSDLLSPIVAVMEEEDEAFWCFVGFMRKARHNFRLDEIGIRRQLSTVSKIIKIKDSHLYKHLEMLQAEDCFFVYRMVVVLFRRELTFEQTLCLWEVMWADQAAIRAGIEKSAWGRIRQHAPPTEDLLLYAIAACVLRRRKLIIEKYNSMDEILRECNSMAGQLDVWELLDDAHDLVVTLHDKI